jgi:hypothetical protein
MNPNPGVYLLNHVIYSKFYNKDHVKIGSSIDVGRRYRSGDYTTMFLPEDRPIFIGSIHPNGYNSIKEIQFLERVTHHHFGKVRLNKKRELFESIKLSDITNFYDSIIIIIINFIITCDIINICIKQYL